MSVRYRAGALLSVAALSLVSTGVLTSAEAAQQGNGTVSIQISKKGALTVSKTKLKTGLVKLAVKAPGGGATAEVIKLDAGYSFAQYSKDVVAGAFQGKKKPWLRVLDKVTFYGGIGSAKGKTTTGAIALPKAGSYIVYTFGEKGPVSPVTLKVTGKKKKVSAPTSNGTIKATTGAKWSVPATLPGTGTLQFKNKAKDSPHFVEMFQVKDGTTVEQVSAALMSDDPAAGEALEVKNGGAVSLSVVSPGKWTTVQTSLPPGTYVLMCFLPDPEMGMMPHALMGMIAIVTVT